MPPAIESPPALDDKSVRRRSVQTMQNGFILKRGKLTLKGTETIKRVKVNSAYSWRIGPPEQPAGENTPKQSESKLVSKLGSPPLPVMPKAVSPTEASTWSRTLHLVQQGNGISPFATSLELQTPRAPVTAETPMRDAKGHAKQSASSEGKKSPYSTWTLSSSESGNTRDSLYSFGTTGRSGSSSRRDAADTPSLTPSLDHGLTPSLSQGLAPSLLHSLTPSIGAIKLEAETHLLSSSKKHSPPPAPVAVKKDIDSAIAAASSSASSDPHPDSLSDTLVDPPLPHEPTGSSAAPASTSTSGVVSGLSAGANAAANRTIPPKTRSSQKRRGGVGASDEAYDVTHRRDQAVTKAEIGDALSASGSGGDGIAVTDSADADGEAADAKGARETKELRGKKEVAKDAKEAKDAKGGGDAAKLTTVKKGGGGKASKRQSSKTSLRAPRARSVDADAKAEAASSRGVGTQALSLLNAFDAETNANGDAFPLALQDLFDDIPELGVTQPSKPRPPRSKNKKDKQTCTCKNSRCLKLYCDCFSAGEFCVDCNCVGCLNNTDNVTARDEARAFVITRNPKAFVAKFATSISPTKAVPQTKHVRGCNCKNSKCLKNYCECFKNGVECTSQCRCAGCENGKCGSDDSSKTKDMKMDEVLTNLEALAASPPRAPTSPSTLLPSPARMDLSSPSGLADASLLGNGLLGNDSHHDFLQALMCPEDLSDYDDLCFEASMEPDNSIENSLENSLAPPLSARSPDRPDSVFAWSRPSSKDQVRHALFEEFAAATADLEGFTGAL